MRKAIRRGDLFYADLNPVIGSEQGGIRPVLVIQNDVGNHFSPTVVAAAITSRKAKNSLPTHILLENVPGLAPTSLLLLEQLRTIDRKRLRGYIGRISKMCIRDSPNTDQTGTSSVCQRTGRFHIQESIPLYPGRRGYWCIHSQLDSRKLD